MNPQKNLDVSKNGKRSSYTDLMSIQKLLNISQTALKDISTQSHQEGVWILSHILKTSYEDIFCRKNEFIGKTEETIFLNCIKKRQEGWPLDYLLEEKFFMGEKFFLKPNVFIPRADSEVLVCEALKLDIHPVRALDFGAGSGALCLSFLKKNKDSQFLAIEINPAAIECLQKNRKYHQVQDRLKILKLDVFHLELSTVIKLLKQKPNLILANPPYIEPNDTSLESQVYLFESPLALFSNQKGMGHIFSWFKKSMQLLQSQGVYIFEFGYNQSERVRSFLDQQPEIHKYHIYKDGANRDRAALCIKK